MFMKSDGGLTRASSFTGSHAILSGPAGGVVGYAQTSPSGAPLVGFDMGDIFTIPETHPHHPGTSTDVSRYAGTYEHVFETTTAGVSIQAPQLDINTVAAGGGSCLIFRAGLFVVGPESAGANPGPTAITRELKFKKENYVALDDLAGTLKEECRIKLAEQGFNEAVLSVYLHLSQSHFKAGHLATTLANLATVSPGYTVTGPALLLDTNSTVLVEPGCTALVTLYGDIQIDIASAQSRDQDTSLDPVQLSIFSHRFMSTAEQMGRVLQRTSISVNIKERLDFSCAMFDANGG
eukprot:sb/3467571/